MKQSVLQKLALLVPLLLFTGWTASHELSVRFSKVVRLKAVGYDPRDLLAGRYLQYQVDYGFAVCPDSEQRLTCVCLAPGVALTDGPVPQGLVPQGMALAHGTWSGSCEQLPASNCEVHIRGMCDNRRFYTNLDRFYMPEWFQYYVTSMPPDSSIDAAVSRNGYATVREFYVGNSTLAQYVETLRKKQEAEAATPEPTGTPDPAGTPDPTGTAAE